MLQVHLMVRRVLYRIAFVLAQVGEGNNIENMTCCEYQCQMLDSLDRQCFAQN